MTCDVDGDPAEVIETHSAVVMMLGDRAFKLKKPVDLGFLDFSTLELREAACRRELELNRRMSPDVYLGTARVIDDADEVLEHLLVMRRMPSGQRLDRLLDRGEDLGKELELIADALVDFHAAHGVDRPTAERVASTEAIGRLWVGCTSGVREWGAPTVAPGTVAEVERLAQRFLAGRGELFDQRIEQGKIRDGHGDLQAADIFCLTDGPRLLDCLDFDDDLRIGDVVSDIAFLAMDLHRLNHPEAARTLMDRFLSGSVAPPALVHFYEAYRSWVRCEVTCLRAGQLGDAPPPAAARLAEQTLDHLNKARVRLICVGGLPGSGKSTVAARLIIREPDWLLLGSDDVRVTSQQDGADKYSRDGRDHVYKAMLEAARVKLRLGHTVVLDATWGDAQWRLDVANLAEETAADLIPLEVTCPIPVAAQRIRSRVKLGPREWTHSEATVDVLESLTGQWQSWPGATHIDSAQLPEAATDDAYFACR